MTDPNAIRVLLVEDDDDLRVTTRQQSRLVSTLGVAGGLAVTALVSAAELLGDDEASRLVRAQVRRLRVLVEQLLELARLESGTEVARTSPTDLGEAVRWSLDALPPGVSATLTVRDPATVPIDQARLDRILGNLVTNSLRHGAASCRVEVAGRTVTPPTTAPAIPPTCWPRGRGGSRPGRAAVPGWAW